MTQKDLQNAGILAATVSVQPGPDTLKNYNTNVYLGAEQQTFQREMLNRPVTIRATPSSYAYDYGDGTVLGPGPSAGQALAPSQWDVETATSHRYTATGKYTLRVTTRFRGEYRVGNGPWRPINGEAVIASAPQAITVWRTRSGWVQDTCRENPSSWACFGAS